MPAKKSSATTARTLKARVSDASLLKKLDALKVQHGLNESSLLREALRDYVCWRAPKIDQVGGVIFVQN